VQVVFVLFWFVFITSMFLAANPDQFPQFAETVMGPDMINQLESSFAHEMGGRNAGESYLMASVYIRHNTSIGLKCFAWGLLVVPGLYTTVFNAAVLGSAFGYMARPDVPQGENFFNFVTAHGPFELTAIVLSAGAGLRLGISLIATNGFTRLSSLRKTASEAMPLMGAAMVLFFLAALIEGFLSPSGLPWSVKGAVALLSSGMLMFYFVILGFPRRG
jgi:uncharacterized membrane protein SpoIIM required for sporulation